ncbi:MAG TPA: hypothetical protein VLX92_16845 [Kofleriaceae bacterium]|nr:hypothetical protein [Kofleriaceae bacterium]
MSLKLLVGLCLVCGAHRAGAERSIVVEASGAPFDSRDLVAALRVRVAPDGAPLHVRITATDRGVRIDARGGARDVPLGGLTGAAAARLVALAASDLLLDDLAAPPVLPHHQPATLAVLGGAAAWDNAIGGVTLDLAIPRGRFVAAFEVGGGDAIGGPVELVAGIVRASAGLRAGWLELRAGLVAMPLLVTTGTGDQTMLLGAGASARLRVPILPGMHGLVAAGADAFATRSQYQLDGATVLTTPQLAPWLAIGLEVAL